MIATQWIIPMEFYDAYGYTWLEYVPAQNVFHPGTDMGQPGDLDLNDPIYVAANGTVIFANYTQGWGNHVLVEHILPTGTHVVSHYAHLNKILCSVGQEIPVGYVIGLCGTTGNSTGVHLHFEIRKPDVPVSFYPVGWSQEQVKEKYFRPLQFIEDNNVAEPLPPTPSPGGDDMQITDQTKIPQINNWEVQMIRSKVLNELPQLQKQAEERQQQVESLTASVARLSEELKECQTNLKDTLERYNNILSQNPISGKLAQQESSEELIRILISRLFKVLGRK